MHSNRSICDYR